MTAASYTVTVADALTSVRSIEVSTDTAIALLEKAGNVADRDLITGYAGTTALRHLRTIKREVERARTQLESLRREAPRP